MKRIVLGKTGIEVNRLGFGGIPIQRVEEQQAIETVLHAIECGVDFIDTGRAYTTSEERIGRALRQTDRRVVLASKSHDRTADGIRRDIEISLKNLQREYIDLYQCHYVKNEEDYRKILAPRGALEGLQQARKEGLVGHIGVTSHSLDLIDRVLEDDVFETVMVCFSFLEPAARDRVIPKALHRNIGVITMKPFSGGALADPQLCLKYVLSQPGILIIPGVEQKTLFDQNWAVFQGGHELSEFEVEEIAKIRQRYDKAFCRRCDYCQPCTEDIPIQVILGIRYIIQRFGDATLQQKRIQEAIAKARQCSECGECMQRCPYELPIPELIKENIRWADEKSVR